VCALDSTGTVHLLDSTGTVCALAHVSVSDLQFVSSE